VVCDSLDAQEESLYLSNWQETNAAIGIILLPVEDVLLMLEENIFDEFRPLARFQTQECTMISRFVLLYVLPRFC
jgi:hypothetical protein